STHQWPEDARTIVTAAREAVAEVPDRLVALRDVVDLVGERFQHVLRVVGAEVGPAGQVTRAFLRSARRQVPGYSRKALLSALDQRVNRLRNAETTAVHRMVVTTAEIAASLRDAIDGRLNHAVENCRPLSLPHRDDLPVPPYTLGLWLGDGHTGTARFTTADPEIVRYVEADGFRVRPSGRMVYTVLPAELPPIPDAECVVCGVRFRPCSPSVRTCGRRCGARSRGLVDPLT